MPKPIKTAPIPLEETFHILKFFAVLFVTFLIPPNFLAVL